MRCGSPARTMPALPRRWSSNSSLPKRVSPGAISAAMRSWTRSGRGKRNPAASSTGSCVAWVPRPTGPVNASPWTRGLSRAVLKVFVELYGKGLIYKDLRLVNWDPGLETAISDLEVQPRETRGHLWYFRYPIEGAEGLHITIATTRPETMLGDTGIAVHPDDSRHAVLVGRHAILPLVGRRIPIVADTWADPEQGSGAVKITPGTRFQRFRGRPPPRPRDDQHLRSPGET